MTVRTRSQLNSDADTNLPDNTTGAISPADVRQTAKDLADSALLPEDHLGINAASAKTTPVDADLLGLIDSAASNVLKKLTFANLWVWVQAKLNGTAKSTPVAADRVYIGDSAASNAVKYSTFTQIMGLIFGTENVSLTGGATVTSKSLGTQSSGTLTLDMGDRPLQHYTNGGDHLLAPGSVTGSCLVDITNNSSAGAITTSGWTKVAGDSFTTTNGHKFRCHCSVGNGGSLLIVQALQ